MTGLLLRPMAFFAFYIPCSTVMRPCRRRCDSVWCRRSATLTVISTVPPPFLLEKGRGALEYTMDGSMRGSVIVRRILCYRLEGIAAAVRVQWSFSVNYPKVGTSGPARRLLNKTASGQLLPPNP
jgi:hypothetical protein